MNGVSRPYKAYQTQRYNAYQIAPILDVIVSRLFSGLSGGGASTAGQIAGQAQASGDPLKYFIDQLAPWFNPSAYALPSGNQTKDIIQTIFNPDTYNVAKIHEMNGKCKTLCKQKYPGMEMRPFWSNETCYCNLAPTTKCTYTGCTHLRKGTDCNLCACRRTCGRDYPGTYPTTSGNKCYCRRTSSGSSTSAGSSASQTAKLNSSCSYSGCSGFSGLDRCKCRCSQICRAKGKNPSTSRDGSCHCVARNTSNETKTKTDRLNSACSYGGCNGFTGISRCKCRCSEICRKKGKSPDMKSDGSCNCKSKSTGGTSSTTDRLTKACSYSGCSGFTGLARCKCRCSNICRAKGKRPSTSSDGSCHCK